MCERLFTQIVTRSHLRWGSFLAWFACKLAVCRSRVRSRPSGERPAGDVAACVGRGPPVTTRVSPPPRPVYSARGHSVNQFTSLQLGGPGVQSHCIPNSRVANIIIIIVILFAQYYNCMHIWANPWICVRGGVLSPLHSPSLPFLLEVGPPLNPATGSVGSAVSSPNGSPSRKRIWCTL